MKIAILHEMLIKLGWAEKVVENWCKIYPDADLFTLIYDEEKVWKIFPKNKINKQVFGLKTQKIYRYTKKQRLCLAYMSISVEQLDFSGYDVVLCSSSWFAHGAITKPETKFIVYCHSPTRYIWDWTNEYKRDLWLNSGVKKWLFSYILNRLFLKLRQWDYIASKRADITLANSSNTKQRIQKYYRKDSEILYPPVETKRFWNIWTTLPLTTKIQDIPESYYIIISALTEFKKIEVAIEWFNELSKQKLVIIWKWDHEKTLKNNASKNIIFVWEKYGKELVFLVQNSLGLIFPGEEDFWIVPVEVMSAWKPVFAYRWWWLLETVLEWVTGEFFDDKDWDDFKEKFLNFHRNILKWKYTSETCISQAEKFWETLFEKRIKQLVNW